MKVKEDSERAGLILNIQKTKITASNPITSWQIDGETMETVRNFIGGAGLQNHCRWWLQPWNQKMLAPWKKTYDQPKQHIKKQRHYFADKSSQTMVCCLVKLCHLVKAMVFPAVTFKKWDLDYKERWVQKNSYFSTVVLEKTLESPLDSKEMQPVHPKGNQSWIFTGRTDVEAETPILWPHEVKNWVIWKNPDAGKDWGREEKGTAEDEMVGWHHWLDGREFE